MHSEIRCDKCTYFEAKKFKGRANGSIGVCHRHPPTPVYDSGEMKKDHTTALTIASYWCGEFVARKGVADDATGVH